MIMFVFGAGASFDSDPYRRPGEVDELLDEARPPLAAGLFDPPTNEGKAIVAAFPRAASLIMRLRQATAQGLDIEETLEQIKSSEETYPDTAVQLLALRAYLAQLMNEVPQEWIEECQGLTNYVLALEEVNRWNISVHPNERDPVACVTFNYDTMLESAVRSVFGLGLGDVDQYTAHSSVHVFKPHGSATWRQLATWDQPQGNWIRGRGGLSKAIDEAAALAWDETIRLQTDDTYQDSADATKVWLPALSIPVARKSDFTMPDQHRTAMVEDLQKVTTLIAVGWRARERHFLKLLQDHLPSERVGLVAVAENDQSASETIDNLWETGMFYRYATSGIGFSGFAETPTTDYVREPDPGDHTKLTLSHVLSSREGSFVWTTRKHGPGLTEIPEEVPFVQPRYVDL